MFFRIQRVLGANFLSLLIACCLTGLVIGGSLLVPQLLLL